MHRSFLLSCGAVAVAFQASTPSQPRLMSCQTLAAPLELQVVMMTSADEAAAKAAYFAKRQQGLIPSDLRNQDQAATATATPSTPAPSWGTDVLSMAGMCNGGVEYACDALSGVDAAKLAWLAATSRF